MSTKPKRHITQSAVTGKIVSPQAAVTNPRETVTQTIGPDLLDALLRHAYYLTLHDLLRDIGGAKFEHQAAVTDYR